VADKGQGSNPGQAGGDESSGQNKKPEVRNQNPVEELDDLHLQWRVERLIGVFLCSEAYPAFKAAEQCNRQVEEAFRGLEEALKKALDEVDRRRKTVDSRP
jgi:hypothetical protein